MNTEIDSMKDMLEINQEMKRYVPVLVSARVTDVDTVTTKEARELLYRWKRELVGFLSDEDAGCVINSGNVLVLVRAERSEAFIERIGQLTLRIRSKQPSLETDTLVLSDELIDLFVTHA